MKRISRLDVPKIKKGVKKRPPRFCPCRFLGKSKNDIW